MTLRLAIPALLMLAVAAIPFAAPQLQLLMNLALAKGIAVVGVTVLLRAGQVSFGHALYFAIAAYAAAFLSASMPGATLPWCSSSRFPARCCRASLSACSWCAIAASSSAC